MPISLSMSTTATRSVLELVTRASRPSGVMATAVGIGKAHARLVQQHLVHAAVRPDDAQAVGDRPALEQPRHRHEVLGAQQW